VDEAALDIVKLGSRAANFDDFDCGVQALNEFLKKQATGEQAGDTSVTYLAIDRASSRCLGYVSISSCSFKRIKLLADHAQGIRYPSVPALLIGRLAVANDRQNSGVGKALMKFSLQRALEIAASVGVSVVAVDAKSPALRDYYARYGFIGVGGALSMYLPIATIRDAQSHQYPRFET
jgi:predicted GNAT family N-acyltransferase